MIERAKDTDLDELVLLWQDISIYEFSKYIGLENVNYFIDSGELRNETQRLLETTFVLREEGIIVGFIVLIDNLIELLIVRSSHQNRFVGGKLYRFVLKQLAEKYNTVHVECFEENKRTNSILKRMGYRLINTYRDEMGFVTNQYSMAI